MQTLAALESSVKWAADLPLAHLRGVELSGISGACVRTVLQSMSAHGHRVPNVPDFVLQTLAALERSVKWAADLPLAHLRG